jgi:hypothetical protein
LIFKSNLVGKRCGKSEKDQNPKSLQHKNTDEKQDQLKDSWMDGWIKSGRDKISTREPQIGPNVHHTDEKLRETRDK